MNKTTFGTAWKIHCMSDDEWLAHHQSKSLEERHLLRLCDLSRNYKGSKEAVKQAEKLKKNGEYDKCKKLASRTWAFQRDYSRLKSYMGSHRWDKEFIKSYFGINFGALTQLYFQCANL